MFIIFNLSVLRIPCNVIQTSLNVIHSQDNIVMQENYKASKMIAYYMHGEKMAWASNLNMHPRGGLNLVLNGILCRFLDSKYWWLIGCLSMQKMKFGSKRSVIIFLMQNTGLHD